MKALSLHQPFASFLVTRQPCDHCQPWAMAHAASVHPMVKRIETRSWPCPPNLIGERIAFHATKRKPYGDELLASPAVWEALFETRVLDPDGWRMPGAPRYDEPITALDWSRRMMVSTVDGRPPRDLPLGAIVGSGTVQACLPVVDRRRARWTDAPLVTHNLTTGCVRRWSSGGGGFDDVSDQLPYGDYTPGRYAWLIADAAPTTEPIPCPGHQRFWTLPADIEERMRSEQPDLFR